MSRLLEWAKEQISYWDREIEWLGDGTKTTFDLRDGKRVDTTQDELADRVDRRARLQELIARIENQEDN